MTLLHVEVSAGLKADLDRADGLIWMEQLELTRKRWPVGGGRIGLGWERESGMQVATDPHKFCRRTQQLPLLGEIVGHPPIAIRPPPDQHLDQSKAVASHSERRVLAE